MYIWAWQAAALPPGVIDLLKDYRTVEHGQPGSAVFLRDERGKPSGFAERAHELFRIGVALVTLDANSHRRIARTGLKQPRESTRWPLENSKSMEVSLA